MIFFTGHPTSKSPGDDWKQVWRDPETGDAVYLHETHARIMGWFGRQCDLGHPSDEPCIRCLKRIEAGVAAARRALDPEAKAEVHLSSSREQFPEHIALVNPVSTNAFALRLKNPERVTSKKQIFTSVKRSGSFEWPTSLVDYTVETQVCDATYMRAFDVRVGDGLSEEYMRQLRGCTFELTIDGEQMCQAPLQDLLKQKEIPLPKHEEARTCLFSAHELKSPEGEANAERWLGYMLPSGSRILAQLQNVPEGGGLVELQVGWNMGRYTTKAPVPAK